MAVTDNFRRYKALRDEFPVFIYESYHFVRENDVLEISFKFSVKDKYFFNPSLSIPVDPLKYDKLPRNLLDCLVFNIGMVEMISYWKAFCSPNILIKPFELNESSQNWWKKLFRHGLGEFFYTNAIDIPGDELLNFEFPLDAPHYQMPDTPWLEDNVIIPVGGGKDSVVTLELLKDFSDNNIAVVVNHREATRQVLQAAGFENDRIKEVKRQIDPLLLELNKQGFLNGHTPFSALLAFTTCLCACLYGARYIALSNESSANEPTIPGTIINHQYSKSLEFEEDFRKYFRENVFEGLEYFSFLRPLNEIQIGGIFSQLEKYHPVFKSCNAGSKTDSWCGKCSKCLFTYIILSPFLSQDKLREIFGKDLFADPSLIPMLEQLSGIARNKPFECVGTIDEVNVAVGSFLDRKPGAMEDLPPLAAHYLKRGLSEDFDKADLQKKLSEFHQPHFLDERFEMILKKHLLNL